MSGTHSMVANERGVDCDTLSSFRWRQTGKVSSTRISIVEDRGTG